MKMIRKQLFPQVNGFIHGGDYNPEQWIDYPDILEKDVELMKKAGVNCVTLGVFSWSTYEPVEGEFHFEWMEKIINNLYENGIYTVLATPSGARPVWMAQKYPEVLRVDNKGMRSHFGWRHNHCLTSPVFREKVALIDQKLAERFANHPGVILWHISNELSGECFCPLCIDAFRGYLKNKYHNDIRELNHAWWNTFWSHDYNDFEQIEPPFENGEKSNIALLLEWRRFTSTQMTDYMKSEIEVLKKVNPRIPVTTNFMKLFEGLDYHQMAKELDVISWDSYPKFHNDYESFADTMAENAFDHAVMRSMKPEQPFMMMESAPGLVNWHPVNKLKRPGVHKLSCFQAVASGSDTVQYFQIRKGRGSFEQHHGAIIDHLGTEDNRPYREVAEVGELLKKVPEITGSIVDSKVAIVFDWDTRWAMWEVKALADETKQYERTVMNFHKALLRMGIDADIISQDAEWNRYSVIFAPMMYILHDGTADKAKEFVLRGGRLLATYFTGYVNKEQLCFMGGFPGDGMSELFGIISEEIDTFYPKDRNSVHFTELSSVTGKAFGFEGKGSRLSVEVKDYAEILRVIDAKPLATYGSDFYANTPAVTVREYGQGKAYYLAARMNPEDLRPFFENVLSEAGVTVHTLPKGIEYHERVYEDEAGKVTRFAFYLNVTDHEVRVGQCEGTRLLDSENTGDLTLPPYGLEIMKIV